MSSAGKPEVAEVESIGAQSIQTRLRPLGTWAARHALLLVSALLIALAVVGWFSQSPADAAQFATYLAGCAAALSLIWLAAGFKIQAGELSLQREELRLQRIAAEQQARELTNSAKLGSLGQIRSLLEDAERCVRESPLGLSNITQIQGVYFEKMNRWTTIEHSTDATAVIAAYQEWVPAESVARNYIRYIASAMKIYLEFHYPDVAIESKDDAETFVYVYQSWVVNAPYLSHHIGVAAMLAQFLSLMKPGLDRMRLAWLVASAKSIGKDMLKDGALEDMRDQVLKHSDTLPAICSPWPTRQRSQKAAAA